MVRRMLLALGVIVAAIGGFASLDVATAAPASDGPQVIVVNMRGVSQNVSTNPTRQVFEFDLYSLTGRKIGTGTDDVACKTNELPGCPLIDAITTFHLADGDLTNRATVSIAPDPARPGFVLNGSFPEGNTIVGGTRAYEGAIGRARLSGANDATGFPLRLTADDIFVITLDR